jgi:hypothetical protein
MASFARTLVALLALAVTGALFGAVTASAQDATVRAADAQPFIGDWRLAVDAQGQMLTMDLSIQDAQGNVAAEVNNDMLPGAVKADRVSKSGDNLVLSFTIDAQGQVFPMTMTLTPASDGLNASIDVAGGMFITSGKGTRK